jgi:acyl-CoA reductase-like NAD-dependent aldehyde dehydrogenase
MLTNYINGKFVSAQSGAIIDDVNPATGRVLASIPRSAAADVDSAVAAAKAAFPAWRSTSVAFRANLLDKIADAVSGNTCDNQISPQQWVIADRVLGSRYSNDGI